MSGTDLAGGATGLQAPYAMPGTDIVDPAFALRLAMRCTEWLYHRVGSPICLRASYAKSGTDIAYAPQPAYAHCYAMSSTDRSTGLPAYAHPTQCPPRSSPCTTQVCLTFLFMDAVLLCMKGVLLFMETAMLFMDAIQPVLASFMYAFFAINFGVFLRGHRFLGEIRSKKSTICTKKIAFLQIISGSLYRRASLFGGRRRDFIPSNDGLYPISYA
eukprot:2867045-Rhodomonas_salina.13